MTHHHQQREKILQSCYHKFYLPTAFHSAFQLLAQTATFAFIGKSGYTLAFANRIAHKGTHGETRGVLDGGWYHYPRSVSHGSETLRGQGVERQTLPFSEVDGHCSLRDAYFLANIQVSLSVISVANVFALWYDKSHKSGLSEMRVSQNNRKGKNAEQMLHDANDAKELSDDWDWAKDLCYDYNQLRPSKELFAL